MKIKFHWDQDDRDCKLILDFGDMRAGETLWEIFSVKRDKAWLKILQKKLKK